MLYKFKFPTMPPGWNLKLLNPLQASCVQLACHNLEHSLERSKCEWQLVTTFFSGQQRLSANMTRPSSSLSKIKTLGQIDRVLHLDKIVLPGQTLCPTHLSAAWGWHHRACPYDRFQDPTASCSVRLSLGNLPQSLIKVSHLYRPWCPRQPNAV